MPGVGTLSATYETIMLNLLLNPVAGAAVENAYNLGPTRKFGLLTSLGDGQLANGVEVADTPQAAQAAGRGLGYQPMIYDGVNVVQPVGSTLSPSFWVKDSGGGNGPTRFHNTINVIFASMPACTVVGWYLSDPTGEAELFGRMFEVAFSAPLVIPANGSVLLPTTSLSVTLD